MQPTLILERLVNVDRELHLIIDELKPKGSKKSLAEIRELFSSHVKLDADPTKLIRQMRDREQGL